MKYLLIPGFLAALCAAASAAVTQRGDSFILSGAAYEMRFSAQNGALESVAAGEGKAPIWHGGESGLWQMSLRDGTLIKASDFKAGDAVHAFSTLPDAANNTLALQYRGPDADVTVRAVGTPNGADLRATVVAKRVAVLDFALPARLRFVPGNMQRLVFPMPGNLGTGWALKSGFFEKQQGAAGGWKPEVLGPQGYAQLFGGPLNQLQDATVPVTLQVTARGRQWLSDDLVRTINATKMMVNRASVMEQVDLNLVDTPNGPWLSGSKFKGAGTLWRVANSRSRDDAALALSAVAAVIEKSAQQAPATRRKIALISLDKGPDLGGWTAVRVSEWAGKLQSLRALANGRQFVELHSPEEMRAALRSGEFQTILNPYGEWLPAGANDRLSDIVAEIGAYVKGGGDWWETGGYPFYLALRPLQYYTNEVRYPSAFADFAQLDAASGQVAIFGVQPQSLVPWIGAQDKSKILVPGRLATGGDERGGYFERAFGTFVDAGQSWTAPIVRIVVGGTPEDNLRLYAQANNLTRGLTDKVKPAVLAKMKGAVLVKYDGNARNKIANLDKLPPGSIVHFSDYLKGGFDKEYPDHLPPNPNFGTPEEFKTFLRRCRELGHLSEPYTNPTWWCDHPRGPTFEQWGDKPLVRDLDGKLVYEKYGDPGNDGWTSTFWHPAVQEANRKTVRQFLEEYPVDIQFQDQLGARTWRYDTNPASPTPYAYYDGMMSQGLEDSSKAPLGTEDGHDRVINFETQLCGMAWGVVPFEYAPEWRRLLRDQYNPATWELFPMAQILSHDKTAFYFHDLGAFVTNRETLAYALALGYNMSYRINANQLDQDGPREWLKWLDRLQKTVGVAQFGQAASEFKHERPKPNAPDDDGYIVSRYGNLQMVANLSSRQRSVDQNAIPAWGFQASTRGLIAMTLWDSEFGLVVEENNNKYDMWVYAPPESNFVGVLPSSHKAGSATPWPKTITFEGQAPQKFAGELRTPARPGQKRLAPPTDLAGKAPKDWPQKPAIGVLDFAVPVNASWTKITPADWKNALAASRLAREFGAEIKTIKSVDELFAALAAGPRSYVAIINPYPEIIFARTPGTWKQSLDAIRTFVNNGGAWWETGGSSFYHELSPGNGDWQRQEVGGAGAAYLGLSVDGGPIEAPKEALHVPDRAKAWLGVDLSARIEKSDSMVNRALPRGSDDAGHFTLIGGDKSDFLGGYRLGGWGWLWRTGGFYPNPDVAVPATIAAMEYLYANPAPTVEGGGVSYLWHAVLN